MAKEQSKRIQTSLLNPIEKKALKWLADRQPAWVTSDNLTFVGMIGAVIIAAGCILSNLDIHWLWLSVFGLCVNWYGDSLDGTLARVRGTQRPTYGYFVDHMIDCFNETVMFLGVGLSPIANLNVILLLLVLYLTMTVYVTISAHLKDEFKITYAKLGPTEFRVLIAIVFIILMYVTPVHRFYADLAIFGSLYTFQAMDFIAMAIGIILVVSLIVNFEKDRRYYASKEPLPKFEKKEQK